MAHSNASRAPAPRSVGRRAPRRGGIGDPPPAGLTRPVPEAEDARLPGACMSEVASATVTAAPAPSPGRAPWALLLGHLMIGTGFILPIGILHHIAEDLGVTVATAGALMWAAGVTLAIGAPTMAWVTSRFDRRRLLATALAAYVVGHGASALATDFGWLLGSRLLTLVGAAIFSAQAAATVALMVPPARRAAAIAFVFIGWSVAAAATVPLTSWVGAVAGWRSA